MSVEESGVLARPVTARKLKVRRAKDVEIPIRIYR
jgi:hypothetical protein